MIHRMLRTRYICAYFHLLIYISLASSKSSSNMPIPCNKEGLVVTSKYTRVTDRVSVHFRLFQSLNLMHLNTSHLVAHYSWINTSDMLTEKLFAEQQVVFLKYLALRLPNSMDIMLTYTLMTDGAPLISLYVDTSGTISYGKIIFSFGASGNATEKYINETCLHTLLGARNEILARWHKLCELTKQMDNPSNATIFFLYDPNASTFKCEIMARAPMRYYLYLKNAGCQTIMGEITASDQGETVIGRITNRSQCNPKEARCLVTSPHGWERTLTPITETFVTEMPTINHIPDIRERRIRIRIGICFTIAFVIILITFTTIFVSQKKPSAANVIMDRAEFRFRYFPINKDNVFSIDTQ